MRVVRKSDLADLEPERNCFVQRALEVLVESCGVDLPSVAAFWLIAAGMSGGVGRVDDLGVAEVTTHGRDFAWCDRAESPHKNSRY